MTKLTLLLFNSYTSLRVIGLATLLSTSSSFALDDWPQWRGPNRDGISREEGLLQSWPGAGPEVLWRTQLGEGYSGISIAGEVGFTMFDAGDNEYLLCFDAADGRESWRVRTAGKFRNNWGNGPRSTPTVSDGLVYTVSSRGEVFAVDATTGDVRWNVDLVETADCEIPELGYSSSPLLEGDLVIVSGGGDGSAIIALNKNSGRLVWKVFSDKATYSSPIAISVSGTRQAVLFGGSKVAAVNPDDGTLLWSFPWPNGYVENVATPLFIEPDRLFFSAKHAIDKGTGVLKIEVENDRASAVAVWKSNVMASHFSSGVFHEGYIYGMDLSILKCIDARSGEEKWAKRGFGEGSLILANGYLIVLGTSGNLALVKAASAAYEEKGKLQILRGRCFTPPSLAHGRLYLRNMSEMACLDLRLAKSL